MRNEIFNRINQNRIQYYSELKNQQSELINEKNFDQENIHCKNENNKRPHSNFFNLKTVRKIDLSFFFLVFIGIHKQLSRITSKTNKWTIKIAETIALKTNKETDKLTNSLSKISSQLFEDSYEFQEHEENPSDKLSLTYSLVNTSCASVAIQYEHDEFGLIDKFIDWLYKVYRSIVIFLESDSWFEEINRSQRSSSLTIKNHTISQTESNKAYSIHLTDLFKFKSERKTPTTSLFILKPIGLISFYIAKIITHIKMLIINIFPAINRFI